MEGKVKVFFKGEEIKGIKPLNYSKAKKSKEYIPLDTLIQHYTELINQTKPVAWSEHHDCFKLLFGYSNPHEPITLLKYVIDPNDMHHVRDFMKSLT